MLKSFPFCIFLFSLTIFKVDEQNASMLGGDNK